MFTIGIYGFTLTKVTHFSFGTMYPVETSLFKLKKYRQDKDKLYLTAFLELDVPDRNEVTDLIFHLEKILSFIEQRPVLIKYQLHDKENKNNLSDNYPRNIIPNINLSSSGEVLLEDSFSKNSRRYFIELAINKIVIAEDRPFATMLHKNVLVFSNPVNYLDVSYYLLFSGLESLVRERENDFKSNIAPIMYRYLTKHGFNVKQQNNKHHEISLDIYCSLRNALFHNGQFQTTPMKRGSQLISFALKDFYSQFKRLNCLVILKEAGFNDTSINWDFSDYRHPFH
ncbi:hypothetical protein LYZ22_004034 [Salmonella enterica]|uniref:Apea-like HEPN domain-containing protein n=1 Tax=Salmonella enterica TaxID=28901 RepID=A0A5T5CX84_SALER|nr:hypothetical protein [Salmonella enterica]EBL5529128.1 hypothetical protein [Salmonella enterica subsp. enterica serovar Muenchen]ECN5480682.1 hypothetical protein [Salmonella enterica subsp. enterica serovar Rubislaw]EEG4626816.1 hypothetical protein [Salmonella enterica subsp. enterica]EAN9571234.1 hypothetical protein [Salmonella enterica]